MQKKLETKPSRLQLALNYTKNAEANKKVHRLQDVVKQLEAGLKLLKQPTALEQYADFITACAHKIGFCQKLINFVEELQNPCFDSIKEALYKIIAEYFVIKISLECKLVKSTAEQLSLLSTAIAYLI